MIDWKTTRPLGYWVIAKADRRKTELNCGIILTEKETVSEEVGFHTARLLKLGDRVLDYINVNRDEKITEEQLLSKRLILRNYLKTVLKFGASDKDEPIFLLHIADPNVNILGLIDDEVIELL